MKNIAIFGSSRSGKSTLSKMINKKYPNYHIIAGDDIRWAFQNVLPQNNINEYNGIGMVEDFPKFLSTLFYKSIGRNIGEINYIVETCDINPTKAKELFNHDDTILIFMGTPKLSVEDHFNEIRKYQTEKDWTYYRNDEKLLDHCKHWIEISKEYEKECKNLSIWFVDTSYNRDKVLTETLEKIDKLIK